MSYSVANYSVASVATTFGTQLWELLSVASNRKYIQQVIYIKSFLDITFVQLGA